MRGPAPLLVLVILGISLTCAPTFAQDKNAPSELQTESPFAEEIKHLESAADKAARVSAFEKILSKAGDLKREPEPLVSVLQNKKPENAYTDLLLHDVAAADYVGVPSFNAEPRQFRTAPLWGVRDTAPYMHNAAAATLEEAIALHGGEAEASRLAYEALNADEREALLAFLNSL